MNTSPSFHTRTIVSTFTILLSLPAVIAVVHTNGRSATPVFSASLNLTQRALQRCGSVSVTSSWDTGTANSVRTRVSHAGQTLLTASQTGAAPLARDVLLNLSLTCTQTRSVLKVHTRVSRDLPGKAIDIDVAQSRRSVTSLEAQGEPAVLPSTALNPVWLMEKTRLHQATVLASSERD